tara:strand:+ start:16322 stop:17113 length:792 start_codon:yes stop_codon:yes gene_type:complete
MDLNLTNKVALVCASSQGLGKASAYELSKEGVKVIVCSRNEEKLKKAAEEISQKTGNEVIAITADLANKEDIVNLVEDSQKAFGSIDILVNNAGGPRPSTFRDIEDNEWIEAINLTMMSVIRLTKLVLPGMIEQGSGRIINISSVSVKNPVPGLFLSNSIRMGVLGWAKALSDEVAEHGITVNTICPGHTKTERVEQILENRIKQTGKSKEELEDQIAQNIPMKRVGQPEDLASLVSFLSSSKASYLTGLAIQVDGGSTRTFY